MLLQLKRRHIGKDELCKVESPKVSESPKQDIEIYKTGDYIEFDYIEADSESHSRKIGCELFYVTGKDSEHIDIDDSHPTCTKKYGFDRIDGAICGAYVQMGFPNYYIEAIAIHDIPLKRNSIMNNSDTTTTSTNYQVCCNLPCGTVVSRRELMYTYMYLAVVLNLTPIKK